MDTSSAEFQAALRDHAKSLGVDADANPHLMSLVQEALLAELPDGWEQSETEDGTLYYFNNDTDESIWEHPLDAHYRELLKKKLAEGPPAKAHAAPAATEIPPAATTPVIAPVAEISKLEIYSFDDDSDDDGSSSTTIQPMGRATTTATANTVETRGTSRISSLFATLEPVPSFSATSAAMAKSATTAGGGRTDPISTTSRSQAIGGFGRDRSWLLDNDDDLDIPTLPLTKPTTPTTTTAAAVVESSRPSTAGSSGVPSSLPSYTSRLFGNGGSTATATGTASLSMGSSAPVTSTITPLDLGSYATSSTGGSKTSPRRGIASAIKGPFFQEMAAAPASSAMTSSPGMASTVDATKLKELEKRTSELLTQLEHAKRDHETTKQQLETATQDAKEANYLKMKANETKAKLSEKESELAKAKQQIQQLQDDLQRAQSECSILRQSQQTTTQREIVDAKKAASELQSQLHASENKCQEMELLTQETKLQLDKLTCELRETMAASEIQLRETVAAGDKQLRETVALVETEKKANAQLREHIEHEKARAKELHDQVATLQTELLDQSRKTESWSSLQDSLDRQTKHVCELETKLRDLHAKLLAAEANETHAVRECKLKDNELHDLNRKLGQLTHDLETRDTQIRELHETMRKDQAQVMEIQAKARSQQQFEHEFDRKRQFLESEKHDLASQVVAKTEQLQSLQKKLAQTQEDHVNATAKLESELHAVQLQLQQIKSHEVVPLEKQRDQLSHDSERLRERASSLDKELRQVQQDLATESSKTHQLHVEIEAWKRKEQQQKTQKDAYFAEKASLEKDLQSLQSEASTFKHDKRLELDKLSFRLRELESQVAQKDYELVRCEEKFTKAESWRLKESRRVDERDAHVLELKQELAQLKSRHVDAENNVVIHELRREKELLESKIVGLQREVDDERTARGVAAQKFQADSEQLQKAMEWQLPQLAAACVSRSSEEWTRKCQDLVQNLKDNWHLQALSERNELLERLQQSDARRENAEQKWKTAISECEFLRKEVHRLEDNTKVLLEQLHTIRVFMTQRAGTAGFYTGSAPYPIPWSHTSQAPPAPPQAPQSPPQSPPCPAPPSAANTSDFAAVNTLNAQLAVLHAQFQQLFDAHATPSPPAAVRPFGFRVAATRYSPSDRFEIPPSPVSTTKLKKSPFHTSSSSGTSSSSRCSSPSFAMDQTLESLLETNKSPHRKDPHAEKEELLATLESLGAGEGSGSGSGGSLVPSSGTTSTGDWYQKDYWRAKYQH